MKDEQGRELIKLTNEALQAGINACGPGRPFRVIGKAIHELTCNTNYSISTQFAGHGIGTVFHRPPWILHHRMQLVYTIANRVLKLDVFGHAVNDEPGVMLPGDCFTIEVSGAYPHIFYVADSNDYSLL